MKITVRVSSVAFLYTVIFFVIVFFIGIATCEMPLLFESSKDLYRILSGLSLALEWFPSILLSGFLLGFSKAFSAFDTKDMLRFSPILIKNFKGVLRISLFGALLCFISSEVVVPVISSNKTEMENMKTDFEWYENIAQNSLDRQQFSDSYFYNNTALSIAEKDEEHKQIALEFQRMLESTDIRFKSMVAQQEFSKTKAKEKATALNGYNQVLSTGKTATDLLDLARAAYKKNDYFGAHYNATLAASISGEENPNKPEMLQIASKSWNMLREGSSNLDSEGEFLFAQKRIGYSALINKDILKAYYTFHNLENEYPLDPDVEKYAEIAKKKLTEQYFFFEETAFVKHFEVNRNVYFTISRSDGGKDLFFIRGISIVKNTGKVIQYLRGLNYISYSKDNTMEMTCRVPFAKLEGETISSFASDISFDGISSDETVPVILLNSVAQDDVTIQSNPIYEYAEGIPEMEYHFLILPISLKEFNEACRASSGAKAMNLFDLFSFSSKADKYGFSNAVFGTEMLSRLCHPLLMLLLFVLSAVLGWNYHLEVGKIFKFTWIFIFPIAIVLLKIVLGFLVYGLSILYFILFSRLGMFSAFLTVLLFVVAICFAGIKFLGLHGENYYEDESIEDEK